MLVLLKARDIEHLAVPEELELQLQAAVVQRNVDEFLEFLNNLNDQPNLEWQPPAPEPGDFPWISMNIT